VTHRGPCQPPPVCDSVSARRCRPSLLPAGQKSCHSATEKAAGCVTRAVLDSKPGFVAAEERDSPLPSLAQRHSGLEAPAQHPDGAAARARRGLACACQAARLPPQEAGPARGCGVAAQGFVLAGPGSAPQRATGPDVWWCGTAANAPVCRLRVLVWGAGRGKESK